MKKKVMIGVSVAGLICIAVFFIIHFIFLRTVNNKTSRPPRPVVVLKVKPGVDVQSISFPAYVQASSEAVLFFRVSGPIIEVNVKPGDKVKKGTVLFKIDPRNYDREVNLLKNQLTAEKARLEKAMLEFERHKKLLSKRIVSKRDFDLKRSIFLVEQAKASELENRIKIAMDHLKDTELKAPFNGIVTEQHLEKHEMARAGEPVLAMHDICTIEVVAFIPEGDISCIVSDKNNQFHACFAPIKNHNFPVKLQEWNTRANSATRTYEVVFRMKQPSGSPILPGMTAELIWQKHNSNPSSIFNIPLYAFVSTTHITGKLWVIDQESQTAAPKTVAIGKYCEGGSLQVISGLESDCLVVVEGAHFLREGNKVELVQKNKGNK